VVELEVIKEGTSYSIRFQR
jgi:hypothetical protein